MGIKPKFSSANARTYASRTFTNRENHVKTFGRTLKEKYDGKHSVIVFYGMGGVGKTTLNRELKKLLLETCPQSQLMSLNFEVPEFRTSESALLYLARELTEKYEIRFSSFEMAYAFLQQKLNPNSSLKDNSSKILEDTDNIGELLSSFEMLPMIGIIPKIAKVVLSCSEYIKKWWNDRGKILLQELEELTPIEIRNRLPFYFASDLKDYRNTHKQTIVAFLDTYEALWENDRREATFFSRDEWIRELIAHLPDVIWFITGRERLRWEEIDNNWLEVLEQHLLENLSIEDSKRFLKSCGIKDISLIEFLAECSHGLPFYLDLQVDLACEIRSRYSREPAITDFSVKPRELAERFLRHIDLSEAEALKALSLAGVWDFEIFHRLMTELNTGFPSSRFCDLLRFSFVNEASLDFYSINTLFSEVIKDKIDAKLKEKAYIVLSSIFRKKLDEGIDFSSGNICFVFLGWLDFSLASGDFSGLCDSFGTYCKKFMAAANYDFVIWANQLLIKHFEECNLSPWLLIAFHHLDASCKLHAGYLYEAEESFRNCEKILTNFESELACDMPMFSSMISIGLGRIFIEKHNYSDAETYFWKAFNLIVENNIEIEELYLHELFTLLPCAISFSISESKRSEFVEKSNHYLEKIKAPNTLIKAKLLSSYASGLISLGLFSDAKRAIMQSIKHLEESHNEHTIDMALNYFNLACLEKEKLDSSEVLLRKAIVLAQELNELSCVTMFQRELAFMLSANFPARREEPECILKSNVDFYKDICINSRKYLLSLADAWQDLGEYYLLNKNFDSAEGAFKESYQIRLEQEGEMSLTAEIIRKFLIQSLEGQNKIEEAKILYEVSHTFNNQAKEHHSL